MNYYTLKECVYNPVSEWNWEEVALLSAQQLEALCQILGVPYSGTKQEKFNRLMVVAEIRTLLANYNTPEELTAKFKRAELSGLAKKVGALHYLSKRAIAVSLLNWRNECRRKGQQAVKDAIAQIKEQKAPKQLRLDLFGVAK